VFGYAAGALAAELDPGDGYAIRDFDGAANALARERVRCAFWDFFAGSSAGQ
jgi:hypothetical protein